MFRAGRTKVLWRSSLVHQLLAFADGLEYTMKTDGAIFRTRGCQSLSCVIRRQTAGGVVEDRVVRENWNGDKLDGTGPSGIDS